MLSSKNYKHLVAKNPDDSRLFQFEDNLQPFLDKLKSEELQQLVKRSKALYSTDQSFVFRQPSGLPSNAFLRVGNIQTSRGALDSLFFWLLPHLADINGILIDTWSISSIALNASRLLGTYDRKNKTLVRIEMLDHYLDRGAETRDELEDILRRVSDKFQKPFLILFSATMTGKSLEYLSSVLATMKCPPALQKFLVLFRLGSSPIEANNIPIDVLCDFRGKMPDEGEKDGQKGITQIKIDSRTYFPVFPTDKTDKEVHLNKKTVAKHKAFFNRYREQQAIRIHADSYIGRQKFRHHGIYLDVSRMLKNKFFADKFQNIVEGLDPSPEMILVPPHDAGKKLADIAADLLKIQRENVLRLLNTST